MPPRFASHLRGTRREVLAVLGLSAASLAVRAHAAPAPAARKLRDVVKGRTIDAHAHLLPAGWFKRAAPAPITKERAILAAKSGYIPIDDPATLVDQNWERLQAYDAAVRDGSMAATAAFLVGEMDRAGIDLAVTLYIDEINRPYRREYAVTLDKILEDCAWLNTKYAGRFVNYFGVDPRRGKEGVALLERAVKDYGFRGMGEWITQFWKVFPNDREVAYPYLQKCVELGIPFANNGTGPEPTEAPAVFEQVLTDFPTLKVIHAGAGMMTDKEKAASGGERLPYEFLNLAAKHRNFYLDLDDWERHDEPGLKYVFAFLRAAFDSPAAARVMFGSDFPVWAPVYSQADWVETLLNKAEGLGFKFSDKEWGLFFSQNAADLLG